MFWDQQCLTGSRPLSLYLLHLPVVLCPSNLLGAGGDDMQEHPFIGGQSRTEMTG